MTTHEITELVTIATCSCGAQFSGRDEAEAETLICEHKRRVESERPSDDNRDQWRMFNPDGTPRFPDRS